MNLYLFQLTTMLGDTDTDLCPDPSLNSETITPIPSTSKTIPGKEHACDAESFDKEMDMQRR